MSQPRKTTAAQRAALVRRFQADRPPVAELAAEAGVSADTVYRILSAAGIEVVRGTRLTAAQVLQLVGAYKGGASISAAGRTVGIVYSSARRVLESAGALRPRKRSS